MSVLNIPNHNFTSNFFAPPHSQKINNMFYYYYYYYYYYFFTRKVTFLVRFYSIL